MSSEEESDVRTVKLTGPVTLYESSDVREALIDALAEGKSIRVDLELSGPWDIAGFQLLISAVMSGKKAGLPVKLAGVPRVFRDVVGRAGLSAWLEEVAESYQ